MNSAEILKQWLAAINDHDVSALTALMATDHVFVDSLGNRVDGARSMEAGWRCYFAMCPDYWIRADHAMAEGETMLDAGAAGGTIDGESWRTPAAWKGGDPRRQCCGMAGVCGQQASLRNPGKASAVATLQLYRSSTPGVSQWPQFVARRFAIVKHNHC